MRHFRLSLFPFLVIATFAGRLLIALDPDKPITHYLTDQWTIAAGLPGNTIISMARTPDGYLWLATSKGLVRFDGIKFSKILFHESLGADGPKDPAPDTVFVDPEGVLWIGGIAGLTSYRYDTRRFKTYTQKDGLTGDRFRRIQSDMKGNLWVSFFAGYVNHFSRGKFTAYTASHGLTGKKISSILEDKNGALLFGTRENGVFQFQQGRFTRYEIPGLDDGYLIGALYEDRSGILWIGTNNGLFRVNGAAVHVFTTAHGLSDNYIRDIVEDDDGNLWVGTVNGLNRMDRGRRRFGNILKNHVITCLFNDGEGGLWIGTYDSGVIRLKDGRFRSWPAAKKHRREIIYSLFEDRRGDTWIGSLHGELYRYRDETCIETLHIPGISGFGISALAEDGEGNLWLGTNGKGVFQRKGAGFVNFTSHDGLADNLVLSISVDSQGDLWIGTFDGVSRRRDGAFQSYKTGDGLLGKMVYNVYEGRRKDILIATDKGLSILENGEFSKDKVTTYFHDTPVTCVHRDKQNVLWIGTHGAGLIRFADGTFTSYTPAHGMISRFIYQLLEDKREYLWMMSDSGILRVNKEELSRVAAGKFPYINCTAFGLSDGMNSIEFTNKFSRHSALKTGTGTFMFITNKGVTMVDPEKIRINKRPPPVVIEKMVLNDDSLPIPLPTDSRRFRGARRLTFHFTAPTFISPENVKFKYKLDGVDQAWMYLRPGKRKTARYDAPGPGTYTFRVTAGNIDGVWNKTGAAVTFTLAPFFHQTPVFKLLVALVLSLFTSGAYFFYRRRRFRKAGKYKSSSLNPVYVEECIKKLTHLLEVEKVYRDEDISLQSLAAKLSITPHQLSQILNAKLHKSFADVINTYRVEEVKQLLADPKTANRKIFAMAVDVGFSTRTAFNAAFKKYTKMTPSEYKKHPASTDRM